MLLTITLSWTSGQSFHGKVGVYFLCVKKGNNIVVTKNRAASKLFFFQKIVEVVFGRLGGGEKGAK